MNAYEKSRIINFSQGTTSFVGASAAKAKAEYERSFNLALERVPDATRNGIAQEFIARPTKGSDRFELCSHADETFNAGDDIYCYGSHWIVTDVGAYKNVYTKGYMKRCNLVFKWMLDGQVCQKNAVVDAGSYSTMTKEMLYMTRLDREMKVYMPLDDDTKRITLGTRFSMGTMYDTDGNEVLICYRVTAFDPETENFGDDHLLALNVKSDSYDPSTDNLELEVCDYIVIPHPVVATNHCEITCGGDAILRIGGTQKKFTATFYNGSGIVLPETDTVWAITTLDETGLIRVSTTADILTLKLDDTAPVGMVYTLTATSASAGCTGSLTVKAVNMIG